MPFDLNRAFRSLAEGKALPSHPALMDSSVPTSVYSPGVSRQDAKLSQREAPRHTQAYGGDQAIDWVYDSIGLYQDAVATAPWHLEKDDGTALVEVRQKGTPPDHEVGPRELYSLLKNPNPFMLYSELIELLVIDLLLVGNAYWFKWRMTEDGKPLSLYRLAPSHVKVIPGAMGPKRYEYQPPGARDPLKIAPEEMLHFKRPNPHSAYYGLGVIQGGGRAFDLEIAVTDTIAAYYENRADPSMIVESERRVPRDVFNKLRAQLRARASGPRNAGELLVLEAGLKANSMSASARDALFAELSSMSQDRIYAKFRTSRKLFGLLDAVGADKLSDSRREFDNATLRPFMDRLQNMVTAGLATMYGVNFKIDYRYQMPPDEAVKVNAEIAAIPGIKVREVRKLYEAFGIEESTGDSEIDEMVLNLPMPELDEDGQGGGADRPMGTEPGRPPLGKNTRAIGVAKKGGKALGFDERARLVLASAEGKALKPEGNTVIGNKLTGEQRPPDPSALAREHQINDSMLYMQAELADAAHELERALLDHAEGKALYSGKTSNAVQRIRNSAAWKSFRERVQTALHEGARRAISASVVNSGLTPEEELDYDAIASSVVNRPEGVRGIVKTLKDRIALHVKEARDKDADIGEAVQREMRGWVDAQMLAIADSEATEAYNEGTLSIAEAAGYTQVVVVEEEDAPDEPCIEARDQVWDIATARERRKEHPRCRRAFIPVAQAEVA